MNLYYSETTCNSLNIGFNIKTEYKTSSSLSNVQMHVIKKEVDTVFQ